MEKMASRHGTTKDLVGLEFFSLMVFYCIFLGFANFWAINLRFCSMVFSVF